MREVTLRVRHHGEPESDISADHPAVTLQSVSSLSGSTDERKRIVEARGPSGAIDAFFDEFRDASAVKEANRLSGPDTNRVLVAVTFDSYQWDSIAQRLSDFGIHYRVGTTIRAGWEHWTLYLDEDDEISAVVDSLEAAGNETELVRSVSVDNLENNRQLVLSEILQNLTDRQQEVLAVATAMGYYDEGSTVRIEDVAENMDLAGTTTWEHLSRAEETVMTEIADLLTSREGIEGGYPV